jgi:PAS domain S-box-containing protein
MEEHSPTRQDAGTLAVLAEGADPTTGTILLVDDDDGNRQVLAWLFREAGFAVVEAGTGQDALRLAGPGTDLVLLDVNLPDVDGFEVCRRLKAQPLTRSVSVVHVSAVYVGSSDRSQGLEGGADAYLVKPIEPRELLATVKALLRIRAAEEAARRAAQEWRATFDAIGDPVCLLDDQDRILRCNRAMSELVGQPFAAVVGRPLGEVLLGSAGVSEEWREKNAGVLLSSLTTHSHTHKGDREGREVRLGERWFRVLTDPFRDDAGLSRGSVCTLTEVTRHKELEEQLRQAQRLEAVGRLAGGIAHDFNNLLTIIVGNVALLARCLQTPGAEVEQLGAIERAAWRAADLTRQLLGFSRQTLLWLKVVRLDDAVAAALRDLNPPPGPGVQVRLECDAEPWPVQADVEQVGRVVQALCANAVEAMPGGGVLRLRIDNVELGAEQARSGLDARPGAFVRLSVVDTGVGIPAEVLPHIFDPFATTRKTGRVGGLSLAMVHGIIKQHQGWVECHSGPEPGTTFHLYLPRWEESKRPWLVPTTGRAATGPTTVLVVEDHDLLRNLAETYLRQNGFRVLTAPDAGAALVLLAGEHPPLGLALLGVPAHPEGDLLRALGALAPRCPVLLARASDSPAPSLPTGLGVVRKPYTEPALIQAVRAALQ